MRCTVLVPHWGATPELQSFADTRQSCSDRESLTGKFRGLPIRFSRELGCEVIQIDRRIDAMPECLHEVPIASIRATEFTTNLTATTHVADGVYAEGDIMAYVDTLCATFMVMRIFRVIGGKDTDLEEVNGWLDALLAGEKAPIDHFAPALAAQ